MCVNMCSTKCKCSIWDYDKNEYKRNEENNDDVTMFTTSLECKNCNQPIDDVHVSMTPCVIIHKKNHM